MKKYSAAVLSSFASLALLFTTITPAFAAKTMVMSGLEKQLQVRQEVGMEAGLSVRGNGKVKEERENNGRTPEQKEQRRNDIAATASVTSESEFDMDAKSTNRRGEADQVEAEMEMETEETMNLSFNNGRNGRDDRDDDEESSGFSFGPIHQLNAYIADIFPDEEYLLIRNGNGRKNQRVNTHGAVIVQVTSDGVDIVDVADLEAGAKARFLVRRDRERGEYTALFIVQVLKNSGDDDDDDNDDEDEGTLEFSEMVSGGSEDMEMVALPVMLSEASEEEVTVEYSVTGGTAMGEGEDYTLADGVLTIPAGEMEGSIELNVVNDDMDEEDETIEITLSNAVNAMMGDNDMHTYTIEDDDETPSVEFSAESSEGLESFTEVNIPVILSGSSSSEVSVSYSVTGGTAINGDGDGNDYLLADGVLTILAGETEGNIAFTVNDDLSNEFDETIEITLSGAVNATIANISVHNYTVIDNE